MKMPAPDTVQDPTSHGVIELYPKRAEVHPLRHRDLEQAKFKISKRCDPCSLLNHRLARVIERAWYTPGSAGAVGDSSRSLAAGRLYGLGSCLRLADLP